MLIETFVETPRFTGAVYKASGWLRVGTTQGRGRYDRDKLYDKPRKDIWLRPLQKDWRRALKPVIRTPAITAPRNVHPEAVEKLAPFRRVVRLSGREREGQGRPGIRGNHMKLGGPASTGSADRLGAVFFSAPVPSG